MIQCKVLVITLSAAAAVAHAQPAKKPPRWSQEPTTVMGITLGAELAESSIADCGPSFISAPAGKMSFCVKSQTSDGSVTDIRSLPTPPFHRGLILREGETVSTVAIFAPTTEYISARAVLIEKYGIPTQRTTTTWKNLAGASLESERLVWTGAHVELTLNERGNKGTESEAVFFHRPTASKAIPNGSNEKTKKSAANL